MTEPRYRVLMKSFIAGELLEEGAEIVFHGIPGSNLEPLNELAIGAKKSGHPSVEDVSKAAVSDNSDDLVKLKEEYEALFGKKPHHNANVETLRSKIVEKRKELGV